MPMMLRLLLTLLFCLTATAHAEEFLDPLVAFKPTAKALDGQTAEVRFTIAKGYYLYRDKFRFKAEPETVALGTPQFAAGKMKKDDLFGEVEVYFKEAVIRVPVERNSSGALPLTLRVTSQGCADGGICYPPQVQTVSLTLPDPASTPAAAPMTSAAAGSGDRSGDRSGDESGQIAQLLKDASFWVVVASFFGFGLLLSLTPCVFPMIPILSGIIVGSGHKTSHTRAFLLSLAYVLGMALTYAAAGIAAGMTGTLLSAALQNAWVLGGFALVFVVLSFSMFGFYELQLPTFLQSKMSEEAGHLKGGSIPGVAAMGALSALIVGPCVAAPLAGALLYIGQTGDAVLGGIALFVMALGMGVPLLIVGATAKSALPHSGPWMEAVKKAFGVLLLATAVWLVSPVIPVAAQMLAWALLLIIPGIYMHALDPLPAHAKGWHKFWKGVGLVMVVTGAAMLVGALSGAKDPLQPLGNFRGSDAIAETKHLAFERVRTVAELDARIRAAGKPVMLDFYADWCVSCKEMERFTFSDARVQQKLADTLLLQVDVTANNDDDKALLKRFNLFGPPGIIFFDRAGNEINGLRVVGFQNAEAFLQTLGRTS